MMSAPAAAPPMMISSCGIASMTGPSAPPVKTKPPNTMTSRTTRPIAGNMVPVLPPWLTRDSYRITTATPEACPHFVAHWLPAPSLLSVVEHLERGELGEARLSCLHDRHTRKRVV